MLFNSVFRVSTVMYECPDYRPVHECVLASASIKLSHTKIAGVQRRKLQCMA